MTIRRYLVPAGPRDMVLEADPDKMPRFLSGPHTAPLVTVVEDGRLAYFDQTRRDVLRLDYLDEADDDNE